MLNGITYRKVEIPSIALHLIELLSRQFFENSPKITNQLFSTTSLDGYFKLTSHISLKGAMKLYFVHYSRMVMILFRTGLSKSVFSTYYFITLGFCFSVF